MYSTFSLSLKPPPYPKEGGAEIVMIIHQNHLQVTGKKMKSYQRHLFIPLINYWSQKKKKSIITENSLKVGYSWKSLMATILALLNFKMSCLYDFS